MDKVAMVSTIQPETNYSRFLFEALQKNSDKNFRVYAYVDRDPRNFETDLKDIKPVWSKNILYPFSIFMQVLKDRARVVHLQHEFNMYGGPLTALLFPLLLIILKLIRRNVVVTVHAVVPKHKIDKEFMKTFSWPSSRIYILLSRLAFIYIFRSIALFASKIIVHSSGLSKIMTDDYGARIGKIAVIPHGVPEENSIEETDSTQGWSEGIENAKVVLNFGYLTRRKGLEYLIDAFVDVVKKYPDYKLVIAGGTLQADYKEFLTQRVLEKGLVESVVFAGFVEREEMHKLFTVCEFVVLPCTYSISASGPFALATSYYKPVITTDLGVFSEEIEDEVDGLLCAPKSTSSLAQAMLRMIEEPGLRKRLVMGMEKKQRERKWPNIARKTLVEYRSVL
jgi:glycosyltransferase involved in cell wall biosynthesis